MKKEYECKNCNKYFVKCSSQGNPTFCSKECWREYIKNPNKKEDNQAYQKKYYKKTKKQRKVYAKTYYEMHPEKLILRRKKGNCTRYGITIEEYDAKMNKQKHKCAICECDLSKLKGKNIHIDHNHDTDAFRGILCHHCNTALGLFKENLNRLKKAIAYIRFNADAYKLETIKNE